MCYTRKNRLNGIIYIKKDCKFYEIVGHGRKGIRDVDKRMSRNKPK